MASIHELSTPSLLVDAERLERNLARMQRRARRERVDLRPHVKTHKSAIIARRQLDHGAIGLTVAKVSEAEIFVAAGFGDLRIAYPVIGDDKLRRLLPLLDQARISICIESDRAAKGASRFFAAAGRCIDVLIEVDCGYGRTGVGWDRPEAGALIDQVAAAPALDLRGLLTHAGNAYGIPGRDAAELRRVADDERDRLIALAGEHRQLLGEQCELSIGSTPTASVFRNRSSGGLRVTELRPGNYAFNDRTQVVLGAANLEQCALVAWVTVVSRRPEADGSLHVVADGGRKTLASDALRGGSDGGFGVVLESPLERRPRAGAAVTALSEEHAWMRFDDPRSAPEIGERVALIPNHACTAVATQDHLYLVAGERVLERVAVDARGAVT